MKKIVLLLAGIVSLSASCFAQDEKYAMAMEPKIAALDTAHSAPDLLALSASFERIADAEKTKWLPYYYAAVAEVNATNFLGDGNMKPEKTDPMADKAEALISKADALNPNNSEIYLVKKLIARLRMMADPMTRYMKYGPVADEAMQTAMKLNPENPRVYLIQGQDKYFTPEQFGGSKEEAKKLFELSNKKFETYKPVSKLDPDWGRNTLKYFMSQKPA